MVTGQLIMAGGYLVVMCANGDLALVKAVPDQWTELAHFAALHGKTWNYPAISGGRLLVRNGAEMANALKSVRWQASPTKWRWKQTPIIRRPPRQTASFPIYHFKVAGKNSR